MVFDLPREPHFDYKKAHASSKPFNEVQELYSDEIDGLLRILFNKHLSEPIRNAIRKYLTVTIFAALDYFFRNSVRVLIDKHNLNCDALFRIKSKPKLEKTILDNNTTVGAVVASTYRFVDVHEIDFVFSNMFCMDSFLDYLIKQNDIDQTRFALDGHPIPIEYHKLTEAYKLRNDIAHEVSKVKVSRSRVIAMWDNLGNIMDLSRSLFYSVDHPEHRRILDSSYEEGKDKMVKNAIYKLSSDKIMSELLENKKSGRTCRLIDIPDIIKSISNLDLLMRDIKIQNIIYRMKKEELIVKVGDSIELTMKGEQRFKRTRPSEKNKWKREISPIVCSWLIREASPRLGLSVMGNKNQ